MMHGSPNWQPAADFDGDSVISKAVARDNGCFKMEGVANNRGAECGAPCAIPTFALDDGQCPTRFRLTSVPLVRIIHVDITHLATATTAARASKAILKCLRGTRQYTDPGGFFHCCHHDNGAGVKHDDIEIVPS